MGWKDIRAALAALSSRMTRWLDRTLGIWDDPSPEARTAAHEAGHVIMAWLSPRVRRFGDVVLHDKGGLTRYQVEKREPTATDLWDMTVISLAGLAGETVAYGRVRSGPSEGDLREARASAERLVDAHGDPLATRPWQDDDPSSSVLDVARMYDEPPRPQVRAVLNMAYRRARTTIKLRPERFGALADAVRERRRLDAEAVEAILGPRPFP